VSAHSSHQSVASPLSAKRARPLKGRLRPPGDKSISHRAFLFGLLACGETKVEGLLEGDDVLRTGKACEALGAVLDRTGPGQWFAETVATFGLLLTIFGCAARTPAAIPYAVGLYITAAYWFTASTSFANPAVTIARALSDTYAGIAPGGVLAFITAQLAGALAATALARWLFQK